MSEKLSIEEIRKDPELVSLNKIKTEVDTLIDKRINKLFAENDIPPLYFKTGKGFSHNEDILH